MPRYVFCLILAFFTSAYRPAPGGIDPRDAALYVAKAALLENQSDLNKRTLQAALSFVGAPYVAGTLDANPGEQLVVNLREFDCWTFIENSMAIALAAQENPHDVAALEHYIRKLRYWGGVINGYGSRIHYFTGWTLQAEKYGYLTDLTAQLGGIPYEKTIGYMTARPHKYPALNNPETLSALRQAEARINRHAWHYIPESRIETVESDLREGDIILLTSAKRDLDVAHQGFAVRRNGRMHLLHASSLAHRVVVSSQPLGAYVRSQPGQTGIMVFRLGS